MFLNPILNESATEDNLLIVEASDTGLTPDMAGGYRLIAESTEAFYNLNEKMMKLEHKALISEDTELLNEGVKEYWSKFVSFLKGVWARIKELFNKFIVKISNLCLNDKQFIKKYEVQLRGANISGFKYKGYTWAGLAKDFASAGVNKLKVTTMVASGMEKDGNSDDFYKEKFGLSGNGSFKELLMKEFRGSEEQVDIESVSISEYIKVISETEQNIKETKSLMKSTDEFFKEAISKLEASSKEGYAKVNNEKSTEEDKKDGMAQGQISGNNAKALNSRANIISLTMSTQISAVADRRSQYRSALAKIITYKKVDEKKSESFSILDSFS